MTSQKLFLIISLIGVFAVANAVKKEKNRIFSMKIVHHGLADGLAKFATEDANRIENLTKADIFEHLEKGKTWKFRESKFKFEGKEYRLKEYAPKLFRHLREEIWKIKSNKYLNSLTAPLVGFTNPGRGGSIFFKTVDDRFLLKNLLVYRFEVSLMERRLSSYAKYMTENPHSFLTKYCGIYSIEEAANSEEIMWFFTQPNIFKPQGVPDASLSHIDLQFDIKGHQFDNRIAGEEERQKKQPTYKDCDFTGAAKNGEPAFFPNGIKFDKQTYGIVMGALRKDVKFLSHTFKVLDYSMLLGVHFNDAREEAAAAKQIMHPQNSFQNELLRLQSGGIPAYCVGCKLPTNFGASQINHPKNGMKKADEGEHGITVFIGVVDLLTEWFAHTCFAKYRKVLFETRNRLYNIPYKLMGANFKSFLARKVFKADGIKIEQIDDEDEDSSSHSQESEEAEWPIDDENRSLEEFEKCLRN